MHLFCTSTYTHMYRKHSFSSCIKPVIPELTEKHLNLVLQSPEPTETRAHLKRVVWDAPGGCCLLWQLPWLLLITIQMGGEEKHCWVLHSRQDKTSAAPRKGRRYRNSLKWHLSASGASLLSWKCCEEPREPLGVWVRLAEPTDGESWGRRTRKKGKKNNPLQTFTLNSLICEVEWERICSLQSHVESLSPDDKCQLKRRKDPFDLPLLKLHECLQRRKSSRENHIRLYQFPTWLPRHPSLTFQVPLVCSAKSWKPGGQGIVAV